MHHSNLSPTCRDGNTTLFLNPSLSSNIFYMNSFLATWIDSGWSGGVKSSIIFSIVTILFVVGFVGTFLPVLPGNILILFGSLLYYFTMGMETSGLAWQGLLLIGIITAISLVLDSLSGVLGAKWFGSSRWGILGAIIGTIIGLFFGLLGLIIGPIAGVFLFEILIARQEPKKAGKSTVGTVVGGIVAIIIRVIAALLMITWFVVDVFFVN